MDSGRKTELVKSYVAAYNLFDIDTMLAQLHPEIEFCNYSSNQINAQATGHDQFRQLAEMARQLFSKRSQTIVGMVLTGDTISIEVEFEGILAEDFSGTLKAGDKLKIDGRTEFEFKDGLISRISDYS